jgi:hypothetical protein
VISLVLAPLSVYMLWRLARRAPAPETAAARRKRAA